MFHKRLKKIKYYLDEHGLTPIRAHDTDAGLDLRAPNNVRIDPHSSLTINTGVHFDIPKGWAGVIMPKSGLNVKGGIVAHGLIDSGYTGEIVVKLYNLSDDTYYFVKGGKITQIVFLPVSTPALKQVKSIDDFATAKSQRGEKGFGSSGQ